MKYLRARNQAEYFMQCIIWLDVPLFRRIYDRASLHRGSLSVQLASASRFP